MRCVGANACAPAKTALIAGTCSSNAQARGAKQRPGHARTSRTTFERREKDATQSAHKSLMGCPVYMRYYRMQLTASAFWFNPNTETTAADCSGRKQRASGSNHHGQRQQWHTSMAAAVGYVEKVKPENVTFEQQSDCDQDVCSVLAQCALVTRQPVPPPPTSTGTAHQYRYSPVCRSFTTAPTGNLQHQVSQQTKL